MGSNDVCVTPIPQSRLNQSADINWGVAISNAIATLNELNPDLHMTRASLGKPIFLLKDASGTYQIHRANKDEEIWSRESKKSGDPEKAHAGDYIITPYSRDPSGKVTLGSPWIAGDAPQRYVTMDGSDLETLTPGEEILANKKKLRIEAFPIVEQRLLASTTKTVNFPPNLPLAFDPGDPVNGKMPITSYLIIDELGGVYPYAEGALLFTTTKPNGKTRVTIEELQQLTTSESR